MKSKFLLAIFCLLISNLWVQSTAAANDGARLLRLGESVATENAPLAYTGCGGAVPAAINAAYEQQVVDLVNSQRASNGLPPLKRVTELDNAARYHAADMGQDNYFQHDSYDGYGGTTLVCAWSTRIGSFYPNWNSLRENIAAGYATPTDVMNGWMNSSGHRTNILSSDVWEIGVGYYEVSGSTYTRYWVQDFGRRANVYPVIINNDAATTTSTNVSIYVYGSWTQMRIKNDNGTYGAWQPFQSNFSWTINGGGGTHTVTIELSNGSTTVTTSDSIVLNAPALGNVPDALSFAYSTVDHRLMPTTITVTPLNVGNSDTLTWSLTTEGTWFTVSPMSGATPNSFTITPTNYTTAQTGAVTVTVTNPGGVSGSPKRIALTLNVTNQSFSQLYLPLTKK
jgi:uncharacterized protein YkwD